MNEPLHHRRSLSGELQQIGILRRRMEAAIERLIDALDALDAEAEDLEPTYDQEADSADDEPWLGAPERQPSAGMAACVWSIGILPRPAYLEEANSQEHWSQGDPGDYEVDADDEPHDCDLPA